MTDYGDQDAAVRRIADYLVRRRKMHGIVYDDIHSIDITPESGFYLRAHDIETILSLLPAVTQNRMRAHLGKVLADSEGEK